MITIKTDGRKNKRTINAVRSAQKVINIRRSLRLPDDKL